MKEPSGDTRPQQSYEPTSAKPRLEPLLQRAIGRADPLLGRLDLVYVIEVPLTLPLDAELPAEIKIKII